MTSVPAATAGASAPALPVPDRRRAKRKAAWRRRRLVLVLMSPWIVGFCVFLLYPLGMNVYLSLTHYDLLNPPRWIGLANYRYAFTNDPDLWPAIRNTLWIIAIGVPLQVLFAFGIAAMLTRAQDGRRLLPHGLLPARADPAGRGHARLRLHPQPGAPAR